MRNRLYIALESKAATRSDAIICVADAMSSQALQAGVGKPELYTTIYSGMEVETFLHDPPETDALRVKMGLAKDTILVTQVSRLAELKGHEFILEAAEHIDDPRVHFCFVGDGTWRERIERDIRRRGLQGRFHLTGLLPPDEIPPVMHATDILVHCSLREGLPRTLPQAMLCGTPVISFDVDGAREVVDRETGILLEPKDAGGLAEAIERLAGDPRLRERLGKAGRDRCQTMFDHNRMVDQIEQLYRKLLE